MTDEDLNRIEAELAISLPDAYRIFQIARDPSDVDSISLSDDASFVIERTLEYREGYAGIPPWNSDALYIGDEDDACPYVLFCTAGRVVQTDHGDLTAKPLSDFGLFEAFADELEFRQDDIKLANQERKPWWKIW